MIIEDAIKAAAKPMWLRALPYGIAVAVVIGGLASAYMMGSVNTANRWKAIVATLNQDIADQRTAHANAKSQLLEQMREKDETNSDAMAAIDQRHQKEIAEHEATSNRTIADLRNGTVSLRDKFTVCQRSTSGSSTTTSTGASSCNGPASLQLQIEDTELVLRIGAEADQVADQLRACQAIVQADRAKP